VGWAVQRTGAGRIVPGEAVSAHAGVETHKKVGDHVTAGETLFTIYVEDEARLEAVATILNRCYTLSGQQPTPDPLIYQIIA
jgi:pyrimidine-nucleoside phosphorylase